MLETFLVHPKSSWRQIRGCLPELVLDRVLGFAWAIGQKSKPGGFARFLPHCKGEMLPKFSGGPEKFLGTRARHLTGCPATRECSGRLQIAKCYWRSCAAAASASTVLGNLLHDDTLVTASLCGSWVQQTAVGSVLLRIARLGCSARDRVAKLWLRGLLSPADR